MLEDQKGTFSNQCQNLVTDWASIPRRYLGTRRALGTPASPADSSSAPSPEALDTDYPPLSDAKFPASKTEKVSPDTLQGSNNNVKYLVGAVIAGILAGLGLVAIVIYLCVRRDPRLVDPKDGLRDEKPLLNFSPSNMSAGML